MFISLPNTIIIKDESESNDRCEPTMATRIPILLRTIKTDILDLMVAPEGSGVTIFGLQNSSQVGIEEDE